MPRETEEMQNLKRRPTQLTCRLSHASFSRAVCMASVLCMSVKKSSISKSDLCLAMSSRSCKYLSQRRWASMLGGGRGRSTSFSSLASALASSPLALNMPSRSSTVSCHAFIISSMTSGSISGRELIIQLQQSMATWIGVVGLNWNYEREAEMVIE